MKKQRKKSTKSVMSDRTKGALFLAISFAALLSVAFIAYMKFDKSGQYDEKVIQVATPYKK